MKAGFYVYCVNGGAPYFEHPTQKEAEAEAERLAISNPGRVFQVLAILGQCKKDSVTWDRVDDLPF